MFRKLPKISARMLCPACGQEHDWSIGSAWLANEPRLVRPESKTEAA